MRVLGDLLHRVAGVIDDDFLRGDKDADSGLEALNIEHSVLALEFHQVERGKVARRVVQKQIFRAWVGRVLAGRALAGVPAVDGAVELHAGIAADMGALGDFPQKGTSVFLLAEFVVGHPAGPPLPAFNGGLHELVAHAHR